MNSARGAGFKKKKKAKNATYSKHRRKKPYPNGAFVWIEGEGEGVE